MAGAEKLHDDTKARLTKPGCMQLRQRAPALVDKRILFVFRTAYGQAASNRHHIRSLTVMVTSPNAPSSNLPAPSLEDAGLDLWTAEIRPLRRFAASCPTTLSRNAIMPQPMRHYTIRTSCNVDDAGAYDKTDPTRTRIDREKPSATLPNRLPSKRRYYPSATIEAKQNHQASVNFLIYRVKVNRVFG